MNWFRKKNQYFGTVDLVALVILCGSVSSVVGAGLADLMRDERPSRAKAAAHALALQISEKQESAQIGQFGISGASFGRNPASAGVDAAASPFAEGDLGKDPWGHPYHYRTWPSANAHQVVFVWSSGPNGISDSNPQPGVDAMQFRFHGDDVGYVHEVIRK